MPSLIERRNQDISGVRIKYAGLNVIVEEIAHFAPSPVWEDAMLLLFSASALFTTTDGLPGKVGTPPCSRRCIHTHQAKEDCHMMKITLAVAAAAAVLTTAPPASPVKAQEPKLAQGVDIQIGRDRYDRYDRDRRRNDATVGIGPGGVTIGPRQRCRMVTTTVERGDRTITRRERRCD